MRLSGSSCTRPGSSQACHAQNGSPIEQVVRVFHQRPASGSHRSLWAAGERSCAAAAAVGYWRR